MTQIKVSFFTVFIIGLAFAACGTGSKTKAGINDKPEEFNQREIGYYDWVKDRPMNYIQAEEEVYGMQGSTDNEHETLREELTGVTQEEAYLKLYDRLCSMSALGTWLVSKAGKDSLVLKKYSIKLLNKDGKDIVPLIDFPDRRAKEDSIWNDWMDALKADRHRFHRPDIYRQPVVNKGDRMFLEFETE